MMTISIAINLRTIWQINVHNDGTGSEEVGNYDVEVYEVERGACGLPKPKLVQQFRVEGFHREGGALTLTRLVMEQMPCLLVNEQ